MKAGQEFTRQNVRSIRPADGLHPRDLPKILGRLANRDIERATPLAWDLVRGEAEDGAARAPE